MHGECLTVLQTIVKKAYDHPLPEVHSHSFNGEQSIREYNFDCNGVHSRRILGQTNRKFQLVDIVFGVDLDVGQIVDLIKRILSGIHFISCVSYIITNLMSAYILINSTNIKKKKKYREMFFFVCKNRELRRQYRRAIEQKTNCTISSSIDMWQSHIYTSSKNAVKHTRSNIV